MKRTYTLVAILTVSALLGACSEKEVIEPAVEQTATKEAKQAIKVEKKLLVKEEGGMFLDISYPILSGMKNIQEQEKLNTRFLALAKELEQQTREDEKALIEGESDMHAGGSLEVIPYVTNDEVISFNLTGYVYSGGANGTTYHLPFVYDVKKEKELMLADLFEGDIVPEVTLLPLLNEAMKNSDYGDLLFEPIPAIKKEQKYYLTEDAIVFAFDKYEYTAGAAGAPEVSIAKEKLETLKNEYR